MKLAITALVVALVASSAMASSYLWNGSTSSQWIVPANWTPIDGGTTFPQTGGDTAIFFSSASVTTTALSSFPNINVTGTLSLTMPAQVNSPNGTAITGPGGLKIVSGIVKFNEGSTPNSFAGGIEVAAGGKIIASGSDKIVPAGGLTLSGGNAQIQADDAIVNNCPLILNSGGSGEFNFATNATTMGTVQLLKNGNLDCYYGSVVHFADSSAVDWSAGTWLNVQFLASEKAGAGIGSMYFGSSASGLTPAQLAKVRFAELDGSYNQTGNFFPAGLDATGKLIMVPEPMTISLLLVGVASLIRRRR
jgi:hypothetical protein